MQLLLGKERYQMPVLTRQGLNFTSAYPAAVCPFHVKSFPSVQVGPRAPRSYNRNYAPAYEKYACDGTCHI